MLPNVGLQLINNQKIWLELDHLCQLQLHTFNILINKALCGFCKIRATKAVTFP